MNMSVLSLQVGEEIKVWGLGHFAYKNMRSLKWPDFFNFIARFNRDKESHKTWTMLIRITLWIDTRTRNWSIFFTVVTTDLETGWGCLCLLVCDHYQSLTKPPSNYWDSWKGAFSGWPLFSSSEPLKIYVYWQQTCRRVAVQKKRGKYLRSYEEASSVLSSLLTVAVTFDAHLAPTCAETLAKSPF